MVRIRNSESLKCNIIQRRSRYSAATSVTWGNTRPVLSELSKLDETDWPD
jgi:hypothetical protein